MAECNSAIELSIIVPCFNETGNIEDIVLKIFDLLDRNIIRGEIVLVNDGSFDETKREIEKLTKQFKRVIGVNHVENLGIAEAWNSGVEKARGKYVVTIDADLQYNPEDIILLYRQVEKDSYDLVQGWRKECRDKSLFRKFTRKTLSYFLNLLFLTAIKDIKSGFVLYKREVFVDILKDRSRFRLFQHFFILSALKRRYRFKQVPVTFYSRIRGKSFIKNPIFFTAKVLLDVPRAIFYFWFMPRKKDI